MKYKADSSDKGIIFSLTPTKDELHKQNIRYLYHLESIPFEFNMEI